MAEQKSWFEQNAPPPGSWFEKNAPAPDNGPPPDAQTATERAVDLSSNFLAGIPGAIASIPTAAREALRVALSRDPKDAVNLVTSALKPIGTMIKNSNAYQQALHPELAPFMPVKFDAPTQEENREAAQFGGATVTAMALPEVLRSAPRLKSASAKFDQIMAKAQNVPINTAAADAIAARAQELRSRGSTLPKVLNDYIKTRKTEAPVTYEAGRDFANQAGALSVRETTAMNAKMQRQVAQFAKSLKDANREAAASVGMGEMYDAAIKEYRQAKTVQDAEAVVKKWAPYALLTALGYKALSSGIQKVNSMFP